MKVKVGQEAANKLCNEALYFIGIGTTSASPSNTCFPLFWARHYIFYFLFFSGSNNYVNNYLQPFLADGQQYTHDEFVELLISTLDQQLTVQNHAINTILKVYLICIDIVMKYLVFW